MKQQTAVEFLAERYNYITWMRNRDEISASTSDEWREKFLQQAKAMEKEQIMKAVDRGYDEGCMHPEDITLKNAEQYYNETYNK